MKSHGSHDFVSNFSNSDAITLQSKSKLLDNLGGCGDQTVVERMPVVSYPFIDKVACTVELSDQARRNQLESRLKHLANNGWILPTRGLRTYSNNYLLTAGQDLGPAILMSYGPKRPSHRDLRLEWNPSNSDDICTHQSFALVFSEDDRLLHSTNVTRLDVAIDVHGVGIEELVITGTKYNRSKAFFNKGIQSYYLGGSESPRQIKIYDKRAEQRARIKDLSGLNINSSPLVRIEIKLKSLDQSIMDLIALPNPFRPITISRFDSLERGASVEESMFIDSVRYRGAVDAIARLPRKERSRYRAFVRDRNEPWWNPEKLWETWPAPLQSFAPLLMAGDDVLYTNDEEC